MSLTIRGTQLLLVIVSDFSKMPGFIAFLSFLDQAQYIWCVKHLLKAKIDGEMIVANLSSSLLGEGR